VKISRIAMFGVGYVLGAKAGRERYQQIVAAAHNASKRLENYSNSRQPADGRRTYVDARSTVDDRARDHESSVDDLGAQ
jgi:hypothetical protein